MKRNLTASAIVILLILVLCQAPRGLSQSTPENRNQPTSQQADAAKESRQQAEEGIKHLLVAQVEAWNRGDLEGFMDGYWHSPDLTFFSGGNVAKSWQAALQRYQRNYQGTGKQMGQLEFQDLNIDLLAPRAAVVTGKWQLSMSDGKTPHGLFTLILKRLQNGWRIVHDHTSSADEK
ncbi:MAG TPA: nuclear transport factor 2 family protein [Candidatus Angelobacter sp.]